MLSGLLFGLAPVWRLNHVAVHDALKDAARGSGASAGWGRGQGLRRALVVGELALSVMLVVGAGLLVRSFIRLQQVPPGFNPSNVLTLELTMTGQKYGDATAVLDTYRDIWTRLSALPGVSAVGGVSSLPLSQMMAWGPITVEGRTPQPGEAFINVDQRIVSTGYFRAMQIPLRRGRLFGEQDIRSAPRVVVIDERMADQLWPEPGSDRPPRAPRRLRRQLHRAVDDRGRRGRAASSRTRSTPSRARRCTCRTCSFRRARSRSSSAARRRPRR